MSLSSLATHIPNLSCVLTVPFQRDYAKSALPITLLFLAVNILLISPIPCLALGWTLLDPILDLIPRTVFKLQRGNHICLAHTALLPSFYWKMLKMSDQVRIKKIFPAHP